MKGLWTYFVQRIVGQPSGGWASLFRGRTLSRRILAPVLPAVIVVTVLFGGFSYLLVRYQIVRSIRQVMTSEAQNTARTLEEIGRAHV